MQKRSKNNGQVRPFSLWLFLGIVILLSWPFQIAYFFLGKEYRPILLVSMAMVAVATYICGRFVFKDGFKDAGWSWGKPEHYLHVFGLALFLWLLPSVVEQLAGWYSPSGDINLATMLSSFAFSFIVTIIPAFGEEFGWRGYLLPRLLQRYSYRKALLVHGLVTWVWHLPFVFVMGVEAGENPWVSVPMVLAISFIPTILHAVVFAYIWSRTASLAVSVFYHVCFDEVRDTLRDGIGLGALGENWQMLVLTVLGIWLLWKGKWNLSR